MSAHDPVEPGRAVVVGGGIAGLASAALLAHDGWDVDLVEQQEHLGGRAGLWETDGFRFDTGPSWYLMPEVFDHFFALLGTSTSDRLDLVRLDPGYRLLTEGYDAPVDVRAARADNVALFESLEPGAGRALERYLDSARSAYDLSVQRFLYTSYDSPGSVLDPALLRHAPRLGPLLLRSLRRMIESRFRDPRLQQVLAYPAVFLGTSPARAPSLYHLMSALDLDDGVRYPMGGFTTLIDAIADLATDAGVRVHTSTTATAIRTEPRARTYGVAGRRAVARGVDVVGPDGVARSLEADVVVATADLHHVETRLLPHHLRTYSDAWWRRRDPGPGAVLVHLGVRGALPELAHHTLVLVRDLDRNFREVFGSPPRVPDPASAYVSRPSATDPGVAPEGHEALFVLVPVPADPGLGRGGVDGAGDEQVEAIADRAVAMVAEAAGVPDLAERVVVRRTVGPGDFSAELNAWSGGALGPAHVLTQSAFMRAGNASKHVENLLYAGSSTIPGIGLPMCLISAELVLKRLRGDRTPGPLPPPTTEPGGRSTSAAAEAGA